MHFDFTLNQLQRREILTLTGQLQIKDFFQILNTQWEVEAHVEAFGKHWQWHCQCQCRTQTTWLTCRLKPLVNIVNVRSKHRQCQWHADIGFHSKSPKIPTVLAAACTAGNSSVGDHEVLLCNNWDLMLSFIPCWSCWFHAGLYSMHNFAFSILGCSGTISGQKTQWQLTRTLCLLFVYWLCWSSRMFVWSFTYSIKKLWLPRSA